MSHKWKLLLAAAGLATVMAPAQAAEINLVLATISAPGTPMNDRFLHPWADAVNKDGAGIVHIDVRDGLAIANFGNIYNRVLDDVVQIGWALQPPIGGKFLLSSVAGLPYVTDKSADASAAFWRLYESGAVANEYTDVQPLILAGLPQSSLQLVKSTGSLESLSGLKIIVADKMQADIIASLGGAPQSVPLTDLYTALQRGTADGASFGFATFPPFRLQEVTNYHIMARFGSSTGMVFMSKKKWDSLPKEARDVLAKHMGEAVSRRFGEYWDQVTLDGRALVEGKPGHTIIDLTPAQEAAWRTKIDPIIAEWAKGQPNGPKVLAQYQQLLKDVAKK